VFPLSRDDWGGKEERGFCETVIYEFGKIIKVGFFFALVCGVFFVCENMGFLDSGISC
jgi:hypothetical protein